MTVITKPLTGEKKPMDKVPLVVPVDAVGAGLDAAERGGNQRLNERYHYVLRPIAGPVSSATTLCLIVMALLVMSAGLFGGLYMYRQMARDRVQKWRGWCNVPYYAASASDGVEKTIDNDGLVNLLGAMDPDAEQNRQGPSMYFREEFEIDLDEERYSKVEVPDFKDGRLGRFIHEFDSNKTAIVDQTEKRCFIMPLDREKILQPKSMYDMIEKMWKGYYSVNTQRVRESMRVMFPPLDDLSNLGEYIQNECEDKTTYLLEKATARIYKRSVADAQEMPFTEFAGRFYIDYDIVNLDQVDKLEKRRK